MTQLNWRRRSVSNWTPASYTANETTAIMSVEPGDVAGLVIVRTRTVFNGSGTDAIITIGDGGDVDRFVADGDVDEVTAGLYKALGGSGSSYAALGTHLYTVADTIDIVFTANTAGTRTTGAFDIDVYIAKVVP